MLFGASPIPLLNHVRVDVVCWRNVGPALQQAGCSLARFPCPCRTSFTGNPHWDWAGRFSTKDTPPIHRPCRVPPCVAPTTKQAGGSVAGSGCMRWCLVLQATHWRRCDTTTTTTTARCLACFPRTHLVDFISPGHALEEVCDSLQALVRSAALPAESLAQLAAAFPAASLLAVRSSANVEDLAGLSAAGLYESVVGVPVGDAGEVAKAVGEVWASLYSRRAVLSRR